MEVATEVGCEGRLDGGISLEPGPFRHSRLSGHLTVWVSCGIRLADNRHIEIYTIPLRYGHARRFLVMSGRDRGDEMQR